jgi:hypothetical protein
MCITTFARFEVFMVVDFQVEVFWVVTMCSVAVGLSHYPEGGGSKTLQNIGILLQHYIASTQKTSYRAV